MPAAFHWFPSSWEFSDTVGEPEFKGVGVVPVDGDYELTNAGMAGIRIKFDDGDEVALSGPMTLSLTAGQHLTMAEDGPVVHSGKGKLRITGPL